jgi:DNA-binding response OmpR family regulator
MVGLLFNGLADETFAQLAHKALTGVFTKEELLREVRGFVSLGRTRTLDSHASRPRRKLALAGAEGCVVNVWERLTWPLEGRRDTS